MARKSTAYYDGKGCVYYDVHSQSISTFDVSTPENNSPVDMNIKTADLVALHMYKAKVGVSILKKCAPGSALPPMP